MFSLLIITTTAVLADSDYSLRLAQYSSQVVAYGSNSGNPWALPEKPDAAVGFGNFPNYRQKRYQQDNKGMDAQYKNKTFQSGRFITPEMLEKLEQQQTRNQQMPEYGQKHRYMPRSPYTQPGNSLIQQGGDSYPSCEIGNANSLYDVPTVSPWGSGPDVMYRGQSFPDFYSNSFPGSSLGRFPNTYPNTYPNTSPNTSPWVPNEAIGGIPPMNVPLYEGDSFSDDAVDSRQRKNIFKPRNNAFKPFDFMP